MRGTIAAAALSLSLLSAADAGAYCRTLSCEDPVVGMEGSRCTPDVDEQTRVINSIGQECEGYPLAWHRQCVGFAVHEAASSQVSAKRLRELMRQAFTRWSSAACDGGKPDIRVEDLGEVSCGAVEYNQHAGNANVVVFYDEGWPHQLGELAKTTLSYDTGTGEIIDADIEVNTSDVGMEPNPGGDWPPAQCVDLRRTPDCNTFDLLSVLTHEAGHFLGLSHSNDPSATMFYSIAPYTTDVGSLAADDIAGMCAIYPPGDPIDACNPIPRHGFASECGAEQSEASCSLSADASRAPSGAPAWLLVLTGVAIGWRRRQGS